MWSSEQIISITSFVFFIVLVLFFVITIAVRYRKRKKENLDLMLEFEQERLKIQVEIQEETLRQIGRELHDNLGQISSLIKINLNTIVIAEEKEMEKIKTTKALTKQLITDIKLLSVRLNSDSIAEKGLTYIVQNEVTKLNDTMLFFATVNIKGIMPAMNSEKATVLYRMLQEATNNIIKHSSAKRVDINLFNMNNELTLEIHDDGVGFDLTKEMNSGSGLNNLHKRALLINALFKIESTPNEGTSIFIKIPIIDL